MSNPVENSDVMAVFGAFAAAFEETYADDNWERLRQYVDDAAVYEVEGAGFDCRLEGPDAIFAGIKKSLDGFDRQLDSRAIELLGDPVIDGDTVTLEWAVTYTKEDALDFVLRGRTQASIADSRIIWMKDSYSEEMTVEAAKWLGKWGPGLDGRYI